MIGNVRIIKSLAMCIMLVVVIKFESLVDVTSMSLLINLAFILCL